MADPKNIKHGTDSTYNNYSCRCAECKAAHARYQAGWRARNRIDAEQAK